MVYGPSLGESPSLYQKLPASMFRACGEVASDEYKILGRRQLNSCLSHCERREMFDL